MDQPTQATAEAFKIVAERYKQAYDKFAVFCRQHIWGKKYSEAVGHYIHNANRSYANMLYALQKSEFPREGMVDRRWVDYHDTISNAELMEMILEYAEAKLREEETNEN